MKTRNFATTCLFTCTCLIGLVIVVYADNSAKKDAAAPKEQEREVKETEVPAAALKTLKEQAAGAAITEFAEEIEHGHTFYEGSFKSKSGSNVDVLVTEAGALVEIEESIQANNVPAAVLEAAKQAAGSANIRFEKKTAVTYEIRFKKGDRGQEVLLSPDGRILEHEDADADEKNDRDQ